MKSGFIEGQVEGAILNGSRIMKINAKAVDGHIEGSMGTVISSVGPIEFEGRMTIGYFVEWDDMPELAVFIIDSRIKAVPN